MQPGVYNLNELRKMKLDVLVGQCSGAAAWWLTGLAYDYVVGNCGPMFVTGRALIHALVCLGFVFAADVDDQRSRVGPHVDFGVLVDVKMRSVPCPREAAGESSSAMRPQMN